MCIRDSINAEYGIPVRGISITSTPEGEKGNEILSSSDFVSRYFSPWNGVFEDPVNGSSHTILGIYWRNKLHKNKMKAYVASKRSGLIGVELKEEEGEKDKIFLSGDAVTVISGQIFV
eukprot:TRINITY_DN7102_c0_g2_i1.p1 TRINITY_DN7102_c0_g2~~TRINITY_DN7102_c0_g2_i1.p1  ORF type:complete len:118 (-),score=58.57 TRINITY_DN7102_c0_g2_i1:111-464(-)